VQHGKHIAYFQNGKIKEESQWEHGKLQGFLIERKYHNEGSLSEEIHRNGSATSPISSGHYKRFFPDGTIYEEEAWNPEEGTFNKSYSPEGKLVSEMDGTQIRYGENGKMQAKMVFAMERIQDISIMTYYHDGKLESHILLGDKIIRMNPLKQYKLLIVEDNEELLHVYGEPFGDTYTAITAMTSLQVNIYLK